MIRFRFADEHRGAYGVKRICRVLEIDRSSYYDHLAGAGAREAKAKASAEDELAREIAEIHAAFGGAYGGFNRSSQHLDSGGARWVGTRSLRGCPKGRRGSGRRTGR